VLLDAPHARHPLPVTYHLLPVMPTPITASNLSALAGVRHGFFTREGGVSGGIYASLNCGLGSNDERNAVIENRARVARHLGSTHDAVVTVHQCHSADAVIIDGPLTGQLPKADAIVTRIPGLVVGALAADCAPVLFADPEARVAAATHAGWRGAVGGIIEATIVAMESVGGHRSRISAAIGPCINQAAYEVGPEFEAELLARDATNSVYFRAFTIGGRAHFDLPGYIGGRLTRAGIASVEYQSACTSAKDSKFFSYRGSRRRGEPDYGRQISAIVVT